jgi:hypothetical protein
MKDGSYYASNLVTAFSKVLVDEANPDKEIYHRPECTCLLKAQHKLHSALKVTKDSPDKILERIYDFNWTWIFQHETLISGEALISTYETFNLVYQKAIHTLREDHENAKARILLAKLGSSVEMFRRAMRFIIAGGFIPPQQQQQITPLDGAPAASVVPPPIPASVLKATIYDMRATSDFCMAFVNCLTPIPTDRLTEAFVKRAISQTLVGNYLTPFVLNNQNPDIRYIYNILINNLDKRSWGDMKEETDQARWDRFAQCLLSVAPDRKAQKEARLRVKNHLRKVENKLFDGEMCANCFVYEKRIEDDNFMKCSQCRQVTYCSRECQREHWKKAHKKQCKLIVN